MSDSLHLSVPDLTVAADAAEFYGVADAAVRADGADPFNDQSRVEVAEGRRTPYSARLADGRAVGAAILGGGELDLVVRPEERGRGHGGRLTRAVLSAADDDASGRHAELTAWSHGDHPAARVLAATLGFVPVRTLLKLRTDLRSARPDGTSARPEASDIRLETFRRDDEDEWVALNARIFAGHQEQGSITIDDLRAREGEPWFEMDDFLLARDAAGCMIGYVWLKVEPDATGPDSEGEVYVLGVDAANGGRGFGRRLMLAGLRRLREKGCASATLYVDGDNTRAVGLYRSLGFHDDTVDVQYRRLRVDR